MSKYQKKHQVSPETQEESMKMAKATQRPGQSKEQTKLIAQGIQKGIEQYKKLKNILPFIIGSIASLLAFIIVPSDKMLITSIILSLVLLLTFEKRIENDK